MLKTILRSRLAALAGFFAIFAAGAPRCSAIQIFGGSSAVFDGWNIAVEGNQNLVPYLDSDNNLAIGQSGVFTTNAPMSFTFTEVDPPGDQLIYIQVAFAGNSTGTNWTGYTFSISGSASFEGIPFTPPQGLGFNYTTVQLNASRTSATYTGSQPNGVDVAFGESLGPDRLEIDAPLAPPSDPNSFTVTETPQTSSSTSSVPLPASALQIGAALCAMGVLALAKKLKIAMT